MRNALVILLASVALMTAATLSTPAAAYPRVNRSATLEALKRACDRTPSCVIHDCGKGCAHGSTSNVYFSCTDGTCVQVAPNGSKKPIRGGDLNGLLNPSVGPQPKGKGPVTAGGGQPVTIGRTNNPVHSSGGGGSGKK